MEYEDMEKWHRIVNQRMEYQIMDKLHWIVKQWMHGVSKYINISLDCKNNEMHAVSA